MSIDDKRKFFNELKDHDGQKYSGMKVGGKHSWTYNDGTWNEVKVSPEKWKFEFASAKNRRHQAPVGTGALTGTEYHWYIIADQKVVKLNENAYNTVMKGSKFKIGHKRPHWRQWSYKYKDQMSYEDKLILILEELLEKLKAKKKERELFNYF